MRRPVHALALLALSVAAAPLSAQVAANRLVDPAGAIAQARTALTACAVAEATGLARASQEGAQILAEVAVYRCGSKDPSWRRLGDLNEARLAAADAVIKARIAR